MLYISEIVIVKIKNTKFKYNNRNVKKKKVSCFDLVINTIHVISWNCQYKFHV